MRSDQYDACSVIDGLLERVDEVEGSTLHLPSTNVWLHTPGQVKDWLRTLRREVEDGSWEPIMHDVP